MTAYCAVQHPEEAELHCNRLALGVSSNHPEHAGYSWKQGRYVRWKNDQFKPSTKQKEASVSDRHKRTIKDVAGRIRSRRNPEVFEKFSGSSNVSEHAGSH